MEANRKTSIGEKEEEIGKTTVKEVGEIGRILTIGIEEAVRVEIGKVTITAADEEFGNVVLSWDVSVETRETIGIVRKSKTGSAGNRRYENLANWLLLWLLNEHILDVNLGLAVVVLVLIFLALPHTAGVTPDLVVPVFVDVCVKLSFIHHGFLSISLSFDVLLRTGDPSLTIEFTRTITILLNSNAVKDFLVEVGSSVYTTNWLEGRSALTPVVVDGLTFSLIKNLNSNITLNGMLVVVSDSVRTTNWLVTVFLALALTRIIFIVTRTITNLSYSLTVQFTFILVS